MSGRIIPAAMALQEFGQALPDEMVDAVDDDVAVANGEPASEEMLRRAREEARRQALKEAEAAFAEERAQLQQAHAEALRQCEERCQRETGEQLVACLHEGLVALEEALGERLALLLRPLLEEAARRRVLAGLEKALREMTGRDGALEVHLTGPLPLLEAVRERLGEDGPRLVVEPDECAVELVAHVDGTVVETRLREWLAKALGGSDAADTQDERDTAR